jgi:hypothetical protein
MSMSIRGGCSNNCVKIDKTNLNWWIIALAEVASLAVAVMTVSWQSWCAASKNPVE